MAQLKSAGCDLAQQPQTRKVVPVRQQRAGPFEPGERIADPGELGADAPVGAGERGIDLLRGLAGEAARPAPVRRASAQRLLPAERAVDHGRLIAGRADIRAGLARLESDACVSAADPALASGVPVAADPEIALSVASPAGPRHQRTDGAALLALVLAGAGA